MTDEHATHPMPSPPGPPPPATLITLALLVQEGAADEANALIGASGYGHRPTALLLGVTHLAGLLSGAYRGGRAELTDSGPQGDPAEDPEALVTLMVQAVWTEGGPNAGLALLRHHLDGREHAQVDAFFGLALARASDLLMRAYIGDVSTTVVTPVPDSPAGLDAVTAPDTAEGL